MRFVDCNGLGGFLSLGWKQVGWDMIHRTGTLDFGNQCTEANKHLLGDKWQASFGSEPGKWEVFSDIQAVAGLPPCSGWSVWTGGGTKSKNRGPEAAAHAHTRAFMEYAGRAAPPMIIFECVQQAFTQGREVMLQYRQMVEDISGKEYDLYHVKMNNLMVGGCSYRPRYFWVASEKGMPFGVDAEWPHTLPTIMDIIGDLQDLPQTWEKQPYRFPHSQYVVPQLSASGVVDGHVGRVNTHTERITDVFNALGGNDEWDWGKALGAALKDCYDKNGELPPTWQGKADKIIERKFDIGFSQPYRWRGDKWANVLTGGALDLVIHPTRPRCITHREAARMMGLPDDWLIKPNRSYSPLQSVWGKAVAVQAGRWIGDWVKKSLEGNPGTQRGKLIGDREWLIEADQGFSRQAVQKKYYPHSGSGVSRAYNAELWEKRIKSRKIAESEVISSEEEATPVVIENDSTVSEPQLPFDDGCKVTEETQEKTRSSIPESMVLPPNESLFSDQTRAIVDTDGEEFRVGSRVRGTDGFEGVITRIGSDAYAHVRSSDGKVKHRSIKKLMISA